MVGVHFRSIPTIERDHNSGYAPDDRIVVSRHMDSHHPMVVDDCIALVDPHKRATITNIVLCACGNFLTAEDIRVAAKLATSSNVTLLSHLHVRETIWLLCVGYILPSTNIWSSLGT